ncbi:MAG: hypothetical protein KDD25_02615, partial [Bdellovibrionales bacterium]|nr:hypothetical protein [Bdellovibrionales bacterium]
MKVSEMKFGVRNPYRILSLKGEDVQEWLTRVSTITLRDKESCYGAFLNGKAGVIALAYFQKTAEGSNIFLDPSKFEVVVNHIDKMLFAEDVKFNEVKLEHSEIFSDAKFENAHLMLSGSMATFLFVSLKETIEDVEWVDKAEFNSRLSERGLISDSENLGEEYMALNINLDSRIDRNKGCYPGQEVIEKVYTAGKRPKTLVLCSTNSGEPLYP